MPGLMSVLLAAMAGVAAPAQSPTNVSTATVSQSIMTSADSQTHSYKILTLPAGPYNTSRVHLMVTLDWAANTGNNSYIDIVLANGPIFTYTWTVSGYYLSALPGQAPVDLIARQNSDSSVDVYISVQSTNAANTYSVIENSQATVYSSPTDTQGTMPGTLVFDAAQAYAYPPTLFLAYPQAGVAGASGFVGIGTAATQNMLSVNSGINVDQGDLDQGNNYSGSSGLNYGITFGDASGEGIGSARTEGAANYNGLDFYTAFSKRMSLTNSGDLQVNNNILLNGMLQFQDGSSFNSANNITLKSLEISNNGANAIIAGANLDPHGPTPYMSNMANSGTFLQGWNLSGGNGEQDFISNRGGGGVGGFRFMDVDNSGNQTELLTMQGNGKVGIGTMTPDTESLPNWTPVNGTVLDVNGVIEMSGSGAYIRFPDGTKQSTAYTGSTCTTTQSSMVTGQTAYVAAGGDYAESVDVSGDRTGFEPGDVLVIDPEHHGHFLKSSSHYSTLVAGIYSTKPGYVGRRQTSANSAAEVPMAMVGIVPTRVTAENGPIKDGDLVVTSSTPGYAMHGTDQASMTGAIVGKALGRLDSGTGVIEVLVSLQ